MIFKSITIKEGIYERKIEFTDEVNLVYSEQNSRGKTTLLRLMLYGLGYDIPSTRKLKFKKCYIELKLEIEGMGEIKLIRNKKELIDMIVEEKIRTFVLPSEQYELHSILYNSSNLDILLNILGTFYVDQEKGWTLLNRGKIIGNLTFNIESLVRGLANLDCSNLITEEKKISNDLQKYKQIYSVAEYRKSIQEENNATIVDSYDDEVINELDKLLIQQREFKKELKRIDNTILDNRKFKKFIEDMKLLVITSTGEEIRVTEKNILGLEDITELLKTKKIHIANRYSDISKKIENLHKERKRENEQLKFFKDESILEIFNKEISRLYDKDIENGEELTKFLKKSLSKNSNEGNVMAVIQSVIKQIENNSFMTPKGVLENMVIPAWNDYTLLPIEK